MAKGPGNTPPIAANLTLATSTARACGGCTNFIQGPAGLMSPYAIGQVENPNHSCRVTSNSFNTLNVCSFWAPK